MWTSSQCGAQTYTCRKHISNTSSTKTKWQEVFEKWPKCCEFKNVGAISRNWLYQDDRGWREVRTWSCWGREWARLADSAASVNCPTCFRKQSGKFGASYLFNYFSCSMYNTFTGGSVLPRREWVSYLQDGCLLKGWKDMFPSSLLFSHAILPFCFLPWDDARCEPFHLEYPWLQNRGFCFFIVGFWYNSTNRQRCQLK